MYDIEPYSGIFVFKVAAASAHSPVFKLLSGDKLIIESIGFHKNTSGTITVYLNLLRRDLYIPVAAIECVATPSQKHSLCYFVMEKGDILTMYQNGGANTVEYNLSLFGQIYNLKPE